MNKKREEKIRGVLGYLYWTAHTDGRCLGKKALTGIYFGNANISIESTAIQLGCKPDTGDYVKAKMTWINKVINRFLNRCNSYTDNNYYVLLTGYK